MYRVAILVPDPLFEANMRRNSIAGMLLVLVAATWVSADDCWDLTADFSDSANPNGVWSYNEGANPLPHVDSWQSSLGGWALPQPGFAYSENGTNRLPFWYRSNGTENFAPDIQAGDVVVHSVDAFNGIGNGEANVTWTTPVAGIINISGGVWATREIGRGNQWTLSLNDAPLSSGFVSSGDPYSRATPFDFAFGSGGPTALEMVSVAVGDVLKLEIVRTTAPGDFVGVRLRITEGLPGDANGDGFVTGADFTIWNDNYGAGPGATRAQGDFNCDGFVTGGDFTIWADNYAPETTPSISVPEPATFMTALAGVGCALAVVWRHRRR